MLEVKGWNNDAASKDIVYIHLETSGGERLVVEVEYSRLFSKQPWVIRVTHNFMVRLGNKYG